LLVVFKVLTALLGKLNIEIFFCWSCNLPLFLVATDLVETSEPPTAAVNDKVVFDITASTILVTVPPASVEIVISSPTFNSVLNKVPKPVTTVPLFATDMLPDICKLSPYDELLDTSAV